VYLFLDGTRERLGKQELGEEKNGTDLGTLIQRTLIDQVEMLRTRGKLASELRWDWQTRGGIVFLHQALGVLAGIVFARDGLR